MGLTTSVLYVYTVSVYKLKQNSRLKQEYYRLVNFIGLCGLSKILHVFEG